MSGKQNIHKEMERASHDRILIKNPTDKDRRVKFDSVWVATVPAHGKTVVTRPVAMNYMTHMIDELILEESDKLVAKAKGKYTGDHFPSVEERIALRTNNVELRKKYMPMVWGGVVERYAIGNEPEAEKIDPRDTSKPLDEALLEEMDLIDLQTDEAIAELKADFEKEISDEV